MFSYQFFMFWLEKSGIPRRICYCRVYGFLWRFLGNQGRVSRIWKLQAGIFSNTFFFLVENTHTKLVLMFCETKFTNILHKKRATQINLNATNAFSQELKVAMYWKRKIWLKLCDTIVFLSRTLSNTAINREGHSKS